jgi:hypothetical protein
MCIIGRMCVSTTLKMSMPVGVPRKERNVIVGVLADRYPIQLAVALDHFFRRPTLIGLEGEGRSLRKATEAYSLGDDTLATHPADFLFAMTLEELRLNGRMGPVKPVVAETAHPNGEFEAAEAHGGDDARPCHAMRGIGRRLCGCHGNAKEEVVIFGQGRDRALDRVRVVLCDFE